MTRAIPLAAAIALLSGVARAASLHWLTQYKQPNIHFGRLAVDPTYLFGETYDSNIYLVPSDARGSWITKNDLGFEAALPRRGLHDFAAGYLFDSQVYGAQPGNNDTINQRAHLDCGYLNRHGFGVKTGDQYENTTDQAFSELTARTRRWANTLHARFDYDPPAGFLTGGVDGADRVDKYLDPGFARVLNRTQQTGGLDVGYKVQPKTKLYVAYRRDIIHYTVHRDLPGQDKDSKSHGGALGVDGILTPKLSGKAEGGLTYRAYDEAPIGGATRSTRNFTGLAALVYQASPMTQAMLSLWRRLDESISDANRFYISHEAALELRYQLPPKLPRRLVVGASAGFELDKYPDLQLDAAGLPANRRDQIYFGGARLDYDIQKWLSTGFSYAYRERASTLSGAGYRDHRVAWDLALKL